MYRLIFFITLTFLCSAVFSAETILFTYDNSTLLKRNASLTHPSETTAKALSENPTDKSRATLPKLTLPKKHNIPDFNDLYLPSYRAAVIKAVKQKEREEKARKKANIFFSRGELIKGRAAFLYVWPTPIKDEMNRKRKKQLSHNNNNPLKVEVDTQQDNAQKYPPASPAALQSTLEKPQAFTPRPPAIPHDITKECQVPYQTETIKSMTGIHDNPPLLKLAQESINKYQTILERKIACKVWVDLHKIQAPNICAEAVHNVLQQTSLKAKRIVAFAWSALLSKIMSHELQPTIVEIIMETPIDEMLKTIGIWHKRLSEAGALETDEPT